jgi:hypothetical protein
MVLIILLVGGLAAVPFIFKDEIKEYVRKDINNLLTAEVYFEDVNLSLFRHFPNLSISIENFGVLGKDRFAGDTLVHGDDFRLVADIMTVIKKEENILIKKVILENPRIHVIILEDGTANYDIMKPDTVSTTPAAGGETAFRAKLEEYRINNGYVFYDDRAGAITTEVVGLNHRGSGDFAATTVFDLKTHTDAAEVTAVVDGITYLNHNRVDADVDVQVDLDKSTYRLLENVIGINDLLLSLDGLVTLKGDDIDMDLNFGSQKATFKSILSLVPGVYTKDFARIKTDGSLIFVGNVKGVYNAKNYPAFTVNLQVDNAWMQYPDLPKRVTGIKTDMKIISTGGSNFDNTQIDIKSFHADFGDNPIDAKVKIIGLDRMQINGNVNAKLNLEELTTMFPIEGTELKGLFTLNATADGIYDEARKTFPKVDARMEMANGYMKNKEYPAELTNLQFNGTLKNQNGSMKDTEMDIPKFHFEMDGDPVDGRAFVKDFDNPNYDVLISGALDLEKLMKIYPIEGMDLSGRLTVENLAAKGTLADVEKENYTALQNSGTVRIKDLSYQDSDLNYPVKISTGSATFTPSRILISDMKGTTGSSDFEVGGEITNYMAYSFTENGNLGGQLNVNSRKLDLNEWMVETTTPATASGTSAPLSVVPVPENMNLGLSANIGEVLYDNMTLTNLKGNLTVADQVLRITEMLFNSLDGAFTVSGSYDTRNLKRPAYNLNLGIRDVGVKSAFETFNTVQTFAPVAKFVTGKFSSNFSIDGLLGQDMMPIIDEIHSLGALEVLKGSLSEEMPLLKTLVEKTKLTQLGKLDLNQLKTKFEIRDGFLIVSPFTFEQQGMILTVGGSQHFSGKMNYEMNIDAPSGKVGKSAYDALSGLSKGAVKASDRLQATVQIGGTFKDPKITGVKSGTADELKEQVVSAVENEIQNQINQQLGQNLGVEIKIDSMKTTVNQVKNQAVDTVKKVVDEVKQQAIDTVKKKVDEVIKDQVGDEVKDKVNELKDKFGFPKKKKDK